jgi:signal transduction histidine kinase
VTLMTSASVRLDRGDLLLPTALGLAGVAEVLTVDDVPRSAALAMTLTACLLLIGRRRFPLLFATGSCLVVVSGAWFGIPDDALVTPVAIVFTACFALGRYVATPWGLVGIGVINLSVQWSEGTDVPPVGDLLWVGALTLPPWIFGRLVQSHASSSELLADQAKQLVKEQGQIAERAVADERRRIARELHDVIAHSLSVMVVQAGAAREVLDTDSRTAGRALDEIQRAGRAALGETGRLLDLLRDEPVSGVTPQPVAADLPRLVQDFRQSGLQVTLVLDGPTEGLPAGVDLSVFRVVEEGLTNALKHAPNGPVSVIYRRRAADVDLQVKSTGSQWTGEFSSHGRGLIGMRERVAVFGGSLQAAETSDGGFLVAAQLPVPQTT